MMDELMGQMKNMMANSQSELDNVLVEAEKEGVKVVCTANKKIKDISISEALINEGEKEQIEDLLLATVNDALDKAEAKSKEALKNITDGLIPGGLGNLF
ncbi:MAG: YbaB/EbfC family nucleoid-associated protein [Chitinophagales bacterium]